MKTFTELSQSTQWFVIIKPGFLDRSQKILDILSDNGWTMVKNRTLKTLPSQARELYKMHRKKEFYEPLVQYMSSGLCMPMIVQKEISLKDAAKDISQVKGLIRKEFGESEMRNVIHSSDTVENNNRESKLFF